MNRGRRITGGGSRAADHGRQGMKRGQLASERGRRASERGRPAVVGSLLISGQKTVINQAFTKNRAAPPTRCWTRARAMFFTNNHVKNNMSVSRETLPIFCAVVGGLLTA
jgi:hypothetical protein